MAPPVGWFALAVIGVGRQMPFSRDDSQELGG
jgi:hypothetical protein